MGHHRLTLLTLLPGVAAMALNMACAATRIMAVGDSITVGFTSPHWVEPFGFGFRSGLYTRLNGAGHVVQFVGQSGQPWNYSSGNFPTPPALIAPGVLDLRNVNQDSHRGYAGKGIRYIRDNIADWLNTDDPDVILLMIGINSIPQRSAGPTPTQNTQLAALVTNIVRTKPDAYLIVAQITPYATYTDSIVQYNTYIRESLVPLHAASGRRVSTVDQYANFLTNTVDLTSIDPAAFASPSPNHPNGVGYDRMAQTWFAGIAALKEPTPMCLCPVPGARRIALSGSTRAP